MNAVRDFGRGRAATNQDMFLGAVRGINGEHEPNSARPNHLRLLQFATTNPTNPTPTSVPVIVRWGTGIANSCRRASGALVEESWSRGRPELSWVTACCAGAEKSINSPTARQYISLCIATLVKKPTLLHQF